MTPVQRWIAATVGLMFALGLLQPGVAGIIDQQSLSPFDLGIDVGWQQEVTAGVGGVLTGFDFQQSQLGDKSFYVALGPAWQTSTPVFSVASVSSSVLKDWVFVDTSSAGINLHAGDKFVIGGGGTPEIIGTTHNTYAGGALWSGGVELPSWDVAFRTYMEPAAAPVPEPSTLVIWSLLGGVGAVVGWRRRKMAA